MVTIAIDKWGGSSTNSPRSMHFTVVYACAGFAFTLSVQSQSVCVCARTKSVHTLKAYHITPYTNTNTVQIATITDKRMRIPRLSYMLNAHYVYKCECVRVWLSVYEHELIALASLFIFFIRFAFISFDLLFVFLFMRLSRCLYVCVHCISK